MPTFHDVMTVNGSGPEWTAYRAAARSGPWPTAQEDRIALVRLRLAALESDVAALRAAGLSTRCAVGAVEADRQGLARLEQGLTFC